MFGGPSPSRLSARFVTLAQRYLGDSPAERLERSRRKLLRTIAEREPATLNAVAAALGKGAPAVSRAVDSLVRTGRVERREDPENRRQLSLRVTNSGREELARGGGEDGPLAAKLQRLAPSELRAVERAIEILERGL